MIIKIIEKPASSLKNILQYNDKEDKKGIPHGELLSTNLFGESWEERYDELAIRIDKSKVNPILHIPIRLAPGEDLTNQQFIDLSLSYMEKMGINPNTHPYQLIRHFDKKDGQHVHLVISRSSQNKEYWNPHQYRKRSSKIRQELENRYGLKRLEGKKFAKDKSLNEINMFSYGGKTSTKAYAKEKISSLLSICSKDEKIDIGSFVHSCKGLDIHPIFNLQNDGERIAGVSFFVNSPYGSHSFKGSQIECSWNDIKNSITYFPEDKNFLSISNRLSLEKSLSAGSELPKDIKLKSKLLDIIHLTTDKQPSDNFIKSINTLKLKPTIRKALSTYLSQYEKGKSNISPLSYANELLLAKASNQEYSLFNWERKNEIIDKNTHIQAAQFLIINKDNPKALSWILRYPPVSTKNISFKTHLESFEFYENQGQFNKLKKEQQDLKEYFCDTFNIQSSTRNRFLNIPLSSGHLKQLNKIQSNIHPNSSKDALSFVNKTTEIYSSFLKEKIGEICVHSKASPVTSEILYDKFLFTLEKNELNHSCLYAFYHLTQQYKPSYLVNQNIDSLPIQKPEKINSAGSNFAVDFVSQFFYKLCDLPNEPCYEPRESVDLRKRRKKLRMPNR